MKLYKKLLIASLLASTLSAGSLFNNDDNFDNDMKMIQDMFSKMMSSHFHGKTNFANLMQNSTIKVNMYEKNNTYFIEYELAGVDKKDIKLSLEDSKLLKLAIKQEIKKEEKEKNYVKKEFSYSSVQRVVMLPEDANISELKTTHKNGILTVTMPKSKTTQTKVKVIDIN